MSYRIIFWGNYCHIIQIFWMQKRVIRIITGHRNRESYRILLKKLTSMPLMSQYILSALIFVVNNKDKFFDKFRNS